MTASRRALAAAAALGWWALLPVKAQEAPPQAEAVEVLDGADPVLLLQGKEVPGREALAAVHRGYRYLFASAETRAQFEKEPERYQPAFGGTCARMGARTAGSPQLFAVHEGRIYLFGAENCLRLFQGSPARYLPRAEPAASPSPEALARGAALLDQAARAIGGSARLESLRGWRLETTRVPAGPAGSAPQSQTQILTLALPDRIREERRAAFGTVVNVGTPGDTFGLFVAPDGRVMDDPRPAPQRRALADVLQREAARTLLSLLRNRQGPGVTAAAAGTVQVGQARAEAVQIRSPLVAVTLAIDPGSGRVLRVSYHGRGPDGVFGEIALDLADYREVEGWTLPFAVAGSLDGLPAPALGYTVVSWTLNPPLEPAAFTRPAPAATR